jgi:hypothetical protein
MFIVKFLMIMAHFLLYTGYILGQKYTYMSSGCSRLTQFLAPFSFLFFIGFDQQKLNVSTMLTEEWTA